MNQNESCCNCDCHQSSIREPIPKTPDEVWRKHGIIPGAAYAISESDAVRFKEAEREIRQLFPFSPHMNT
jgi:hypothetical protein